MSDEPPQVIPLRRGGGGRGNWRDRLQTRARARGRPPEVLATFANLELVLAHDDELAGLLKFDEFRMVPMLTGPIPPNPGIEPELGPYPRRWTASDVGAMQSHLERFYTTKFSKPGTIEAAMVKTAGAVSFHPIREWLVGLEWDGVLRIDSWLYHTFGVELTPFSQAAAGKVLIAAAARVRRPGCKFDNVLVLQGPQDFGKSVAIEVLAGGRENYSDSLEYNFANKDALLGLVGKWMIELGEFEHLARNTTGLAKAFLSRGTDDFRAPYAKEVMPHPRQGILIGTTNEKHYLRDDTGNRRFWPQLCTHKANLVWLRQNRDQLFAEAAAREAEGEPYWIEAGDKAYAGAMAAQEERLEAHEDPWLRPVAQFLAGTQPVTDEEDPPQQRVAITVTELLSHACRLPRGQQHAGHAKRAGKILRLLGWLDKQSDSDTAEPYPRKTRYWFRPTG